MTEEQIIRDIETQVAEGLYEADGRRGRLVRMTKRGDLPADPVNALGGLADLILFEGYSVRVYHPSPTRTGEPPKAPVYIVGRFGD